MNQIALLRLGLLGLLVIPAAIGCTLSANAKLVTPSALASSDGPGAGRKSPGGFYLVKTAPKTLPVKTEIARFAGGCFWGIEDYFRKEPGVIATAVGFSGGHVANPSYERVCEGDTGHAESVEVEFDPSKTTYEKLVRLFLEIHNPTELNRQGPDVGYQYRSVAFYRSPEQKKILTDTINALQKTSEFKDDKIVTEIIPAGPFYFAEEYHQQYVEKGGRAYCHVRTPHDFGGK